MAHSRYSLRKLLRKGLFFIVKSQESRVESQESRDESCRFAFTSAFRTPLRDTLMRIDASLSRLLNARPLRDHWRAARDPCGVDASLSRLLNARPLRDHWRAARDPCGVDALLSNFFISARA